MKYLSLSLSLYIFIFACTWFYMFLIHESESHESVCDNLSLEVMITRWSQLKKRSEKKLLFFFGKSQMNTIQNKKNWEISCGKLDPGDMGEAEMGEAKHTFH